MASRDHSKRDRADAYDYRILQVQLTNPELPASLGNRMRMVIVDNHRDTLKFLDTNLNDCIDNIVRLERFEVAHRLREAALPHPQSPHLEAPTE